jgi:hypothetical protein
MGCVGIMQMVSKMIDSWGLHFGKNVLLKESTGKQHPENEAISPFCPQ